jgi:hypothetical protein
MRRLSLAIAALALGAACHSVTDPAPPADVFLLMTIDGRSLPTTRVANGPTILHEELILDGNGVATRNTAIQDATTSALQTSTVSYAYTMVDGVVTLGRVLCPFGALCIQHFPEEGPIVNGTLTLSSPSAMPTPGPVLVYWRSSALID